MSAFAARLGRALRLDASVYEEVEHDSDAMSQSMAIVAISSLAAAIGVGPLLGLQTVFWTLLAAFLGWLFWAVMIYFVGGRLLATPNTSTDMGELLRVLGFASAPGIFRAFAYFTGFADIVFVVTSIWMILAMVIAVRQALDFLSTGRAVAVCFIGWLFQVAIGILLIKISGVYYPTV